MKKFSFSSVVASTVLTILVGCSDPADKVHKSTATEPAVEPAPAKVETPTAAPAATKEYVIRAESKIDFTGSKVTGKHDGGFKNFAGTINVTDRKIVGSPVIKINMKTLWADNQRLTGHLKSADFFDVEKYPVTTFTVTSLEPADGQQKVTGNLELHGVTKSISFPARIEITDEAVTVNAEFAINRKDFNVNFPGKPNDLIRDNVILKLAIKATPGAPRPEDQLAAN
jgi:polyisoprenoid-binding protein YceI